MKINFIYFILLLLIIFSCSKNDEPIVQVPLVAKTLLNESYGSNPLQVFDL